MPMFSAIKVVLWFVCLFWMRLGIEPKDCALSYIPVLYISLCDRVLLSCLGLAQTCVLASSMLVLKMCTTTPGSSGCNLIHHFPRSLVDTTQNSVTLEVEIELLIIKLYFMTTH